MAAPLTAKAGSTRRSVNFRKGLNGDDESEEKKRMRRYTEKEITDFFVRGKDTGITVDEFIRNINENDQWADLHLITSLLLADEAAEPFLDKKARTSLENVCRLSGILEKVCAREDVDGKELKWLGGYLKDRNDINSTAGVLKVREYMQTMTPEDLTGMAVEAREKASHIKPENDGGNEICKLTKIANMAENIAALKMSGQAT